KIGSLDARDHLGLSPLEPLGVQEKLPLPQEIGELRFGSRVEDILREVDEAPKLRPDERVAPHFPQKRQGIGPSVPQVTIACNVISCRAGLALPAGIPDPLRGELFAK